MSSGRAMFWAAAPLLALGLASVSPAAPTRADRNAIEAQCDSAGNLAGALVGGRRFDGLDTPGGRDRLRSAIGKAGPRIAGSLGQPYGCVRALVTTLQKLGYAKIDFIAERPPEEPDPADNE